MNIARGILCIGAATVAMVGGLAMAQPAAGVVGAAGAATAVGQATGGLAGVSLQAFAAKVLDVISGSVVGSLSHEGVLKGYDAVAARIADAAQCGRLPENHDLVRALRRSQLDAIRFLVETYAERARRDPEFDPATARRFAKAAEDFVARAVRDCDRGRFFLDMAPSSLAPVDLASDPSMSLIERLWSIGSEASLAELGAATSAMGMPVPAAFEDWYREQYGPSGFALAAQQFFAERLKTDPRVRTALFQSQLKAMGAGLSDALEAIRGLDRSLVRLDARLAERFDAIALRLERIEAMRGSRPPEAIVDALMEAIAAPAFETVLDGIVGAYLPHDDWRGSLVSKDVADRVSDLLYEQVPSSNGVIAVPTFFGRDAALDGLDNWLETHDRGLLVLCAPSGGGKSALLARWCERRQRCGDRLARHFASVRFPSTTSPTGSVQHLLVQLRELDRQDCRTREAAIPIEEQGVIDALHARLRQPPPDGRRLLIVIDAMDELDAPIRDCIVRSDIAPGNYVIVSQRAEPGVVPVDLRKWTSALSDPASRVDLPPMELDDIISWLVEVVGDVSDQSVSRMAEKLAAVTEGLPLFLKYVIGSVVGQFSVGMTLAAKTDLVNGLSAPFSGFLRDHVEGELAGAEDRLGRPFTQSERKFFAILTQVCAPISRADLEGAYAALRQDDPSASPLDFADLDRRLTRWLTVRPPPDDALDSSERISFDHPRLAHEFAVILGSQVIERAHDALVGWSIEAWRPRQLRFAQKDARGAEYAVRHAPRHLAELGMLEEAAGILTDARFLRERFLSFAALEACEMMRLDWSQWGARFDAVVAQQSTLSATGASNEKS